MLPLRIELDGFLTYREPTVLDFDGEWLWAITGKNGSGKSAIFDAITYALYGEHRGGGQRDERLIGQGCEALRVRFDIAVGADVYRVERTVERTGRRAVKYDKTRQAYRLVFAADGVAPDCVPIPDTDREKGLLEWVERTTGLGYHSFVASVLLQQGKSDRFVLATARERQEILMELLDLEIYRRLETAVKARYRRDADRLAELDRQLARYAAATPLAMEEATDRASALGVGAGRADEAVGQATTTRANAALFHTLDARARTVRAALDQVDGLLADAEAIERDAAEQGRLRDGLPVLERIVAHRRRAADASDAAIALRQTIADACLEELRRQRDAATETALGAERAFDDAVARSVAARRAADALKSLADDGREALRLEGELARAADALSLLRGDLTSYEDAVGREEEREAAWRALAPLRALRGQRRIVATAEQAGREAEAARPALDERADDPRVRAGSTRLEATTAVEDARGARLDATTRQAALAAAERELRARRAAAGEATCSRCGQPVDADRIEREIADVEAAIADLSRHADALERAAVAAERRAGQLDAVARELEEQRDAAGRAVIAAGDAAAARAARRDEALRQAQQAIDELPGVYRERAVDPDYPAAHELGAAERLAGELAAARDERRRLDAVRARVALLEEQARATERSLAEVRATHPGVDVAAAPARHTALLERAEVCGRREQAARVTWQRATAESEAATAAWTRTAESCRALAEGAVAKEGEAAVEGGVADALAGGLSLDWQSVAATEAAALEILRARAEAVAEAPQRLRALGEARAAWQSLATELKTLDESSASIPADDRLPLDEAERRLAAAKKEQRRCKEEHERARAEAVTLRDALRQRRDLDDQYAALEVRRDDYKLLAEYVGRDGLQAWLVQKAQLAIGESANYFLANISGGTLSLVMRADGDSLEVLVSDYSSGGEPMDIAFISGSQRFRAAVALALAIGQYAGGGARRIRSVIIDEGFGSLDADGRREMIGQLKGLEGILDRVILVSHQDEFHDAFPHGYHIEKTDGVSRVTLRGANATNTLTCA